jgi:hypothetical protein
MTGARPGKVGRDLRTDDGSTILLTIGFAAVTLAVVLVGIAATSLYVEHKRLLGLADRLAATAAESFSIDDVVMLPDGSFRPVLDDAAVASSARATLAAEGPGALTGVEILEAAIRVAPTDADAVRAGRPADRGDGERSQRVLVTTPNGSLLIRGRAASRGR